MIQIVNNKYFNTFSFSTFSEAFDFFDKRKVKKIIIESEDYCSNYYCYVCYDSLSREEQFCIMFGSDYSEEFKFLWWHARDMFVIGTGGNIFLINLDLVIINSFNVTLWLVSLYLLKNDNLLIIEKISFSVINYKGEVLMEEYFDTPLKDLRISNDILFITTDEGLSKGLPLN